MSNEIVNTASQRTLNDLPAPYNEVWKDYYNTGTELWGEDGLTVESRIILGMMVKLVEIDKKLDKINVQVGAINQRTSMMQRAACRGVCNG